MGKISKALERAEAERLKRLEDQRHELSASGLASTRESHGPSTATAVAVLDEPGNGHEPSASGLASTRESHAPLDVAPEAAVDERIVTLFDPRSPVAEQYRILRTNLLGLKTGKPIKVIMLSSSMHAEGKSVSAVNLAVTLANDVNQRKVLLIDADLRAGTTHQLLGIRPKLGLSDVLAKEVPWHDALVGTPLPNLMVLPRGVNPPHPAELLGSNRMRQLVAEVRSAFDYVIIDSPPIVPLADPGVIGTLTDGAVLVVRGGKTQRALVQYAASLLTQANVPLLGCILTHAEGHIPEYISRYF